jgi:hypothetical protein
MIMISIYKDTNTINARGKDAFINELEELAEKYPDSLSIDRTDVMDTEFMQNSIYNAERLKKSSTYIESFGEGTWDNSRWDHMVWGDNNGDDKLGDMLKLIFGEKKRSEYTKNEIGDAKHILTTMHHGGRYFITYDGKILNKTKEIYALNNATTVCTPEECLERVKSRLKVLGVL